jgi:SAM-dependent methyltransferase
MAAIRHSAAAERNQGPILATLERLLPTRGIMLEIASGTGQHAAHFAAALSQWDWQPSDVEPDALASIDARCAGLANVRPALGLDVLRAPWAGVPPVVDAIFCANLLHISAWPTCHALMQGARRHLAPHGLLLLYGPYRIDGEPTAPSNLAFDADLRARNAGWGLRRLADVTAEAGAADLVLRERIAMPANNLLLVWARAASAAVNATPAADGGR